MEGLTIGPVADLELHLVGPWRRERAFRCVLRVPGSLDFDRVGIARVPDETVCAGLLWHTRLLLLVLLLFVPGSCLFLPDLLRFLLFARERFDLFPVGVEEAQCDLTLRLFLEIIMHKHPVGWVLPGVQVLVHLLAAGFLLLAEGDDERAGIAVILSRRHRAAKPAA